jgi:hypothetical protein
VKISRRKLNLVIENFLNEQEAKIYGSVDYKYKLDPSSKYGWSYSYKGAPFQPINQAGGAKLDKKYGGGKGKTSSKSKIEYVIGSTGKYNNVSGTKLLAKEDGKVKLTYLFPDDGNLEMTQKRVPGQDFDFMTNTGEINKIAKQFEKLSGKKLTKLKGSFHKVIESYSRITRGPEMDDTHGNNCDVGAENATLYAMGDGKIVAASYQGNRYNEMYKKVDIATAKKAYPGMDFSWSKLRAGGKTWIPRISHTAVGQKARKEVGEMWDKAKKLPIATMTQEWFRKNFPYKNRSLSPWSSSGAEGNQITIEFDEPIDLNGYMAKRATYTHLDGSVKLGKGARVEVGQELGKTSLNGQVTGEHLHFALYDENGRKPSKKSTYQLAFDGLE